MVVLHVDQAIDCDNLTDRARSSRSVCLWLCLTRYHKRHNEQKREAKKVRQTTRQWDVRRFRVFMENCIIV